jgi:hypothetical protein
MHRHNRHDLGASLVRAEMAKRRNMAFEFPSHGYVWFGSIAACDAKNNENEPKSKMPIIGLLVHTILGIHILDRHVESWAW